MKIFTAEIMKKLIKNNKSTADALNSGTDEPEFNPVVKVFNPYGAATWMFTEYDEVVEMFFGLCDLGFGSPELGYVSMEDMTTMIKTPFGPMPLERDAYWTADGTIGEYAAKASIEGRICDYVK